MKKVRLKIFFCNFIFELIIVMWVLKQCGIVCLKQCNCLYLIEKINLFKIIKKQKY